MIVAAVPVKDLTYAKQRLMGLLTPRQRMDLARAMLRDVLGALRAARLDAVWVVTRDAEVGEISRSLGAEILGEPENRGHSAAVARAQAQAIAGRASRFLTVPGDVPGLTPEEIATLLGSADEAPGAVFAPSRSGRGTNGVVLTPPDAMPLTFGEPSFENHLAVARQRGLHPRVLSLPGLGLDIDGPDDIAVLLAENSPTETADLLRSWNVSAVLANLAFDPRLCRRGPFEGEVRRGPSRPSPRGMGGEAPLRG